MPELPEVEAARLLIADHLVGHTITAVHPAEDAKIFGTDQARFASALTGRSVTAAHRHGKNLWLEFSGAGPALTLHFGMTGSVAVRGVGRIQYVSARAVDESWPPPFTKLELELDGGAIAAAYADPRRFGKVRLVDDPRKGLPKGRDVLLDPFTPSSLGAALTQAGSKKIKVVLMDQAVAAGVGNWVADEVLWQARIHPEASANTLSPAQVSALAAALESVPRLAVDVRADDSRYPADWIFHARWEKGGSKPAPKVGGVHAVQWIDVGGRTTAFVPGLQKKGEGACGGGGCGASIKREAAAAATAAASPPPPPAKRVKTEAPPPAAGKTGTTAKPRGRGGSGGGGGGSGRARPPGARAVRKGV